MSDQTKDPIVLVKNFSIGTSGAKSFIAGSGKRYQFRLDPEQAKTLLGALQGQLDGEGSINGVKLDIHTGERATTDGTRKFPASFLFVKTLQKENTMAQSVGAKRFVPVSGNTGTDVA